MKYTLPLLFIFGIMNFFGNLCSAADTQPTAEQILIEATQYYDNEQFDEVAWALEKGIGLYPKNLPLRQNLLRLYYEQKDYSKAIPIAIQALNISRETTITTQKNTNELHMLLFIMYFELGTESIPSLELCHRIFYHGQQFLKYSQNEEDRKLALDLLTETWYKMKHTPLKEKHAFALADDGLTSAQIQVSMDELEPILKNKVFDLEIEKFRLLVAELKRRNFYVPTIAQP